jgi:hypothetical protein
MKKKKKKRKKKKKTRGRARETGRQFVADRDNSSKVNCRTKIPGISRFFRGMSKYFTFSTISRRTPNDVLQDGKVQRNPGKVTLEFAVFML